jgi:hypothetical protein
MEFDRFTTLLINSQLLKKHDAQMLASVFQEECHKKTIKATTELFCDFLVASDHLTIWQCNKLRMGKWKGFYLDCYVLLEQVGKDDEYCYYKARDTRDGNLVRMRITPMVRAKGPGIEYKVYPHTD